MQNSTVNMELLPSGNCRLFTVVPACVHGIAQLGRYLEFLGFISDQNCVQSLVSKDEKHYIVWWTIVCSEEYPPGKLMLTEHVAWAAPPAWHACHVELWGWISLLRCSMEGRAANGVPKLHLPCGAWENSAMCSPGPFAQQVASCCAPQWQARAGQVGCDYCLFVLPLLYPLLIFTFVGQESSLILFSLYPPLQSLFWHSPHLCWLSKSVLRMTSCGRDLVPKVIFHSRGFIQLAPSQNDR